MNPAAPSIHCSAERGNLEQVRTLLDQGVTVESRDKVSPQCSFCLVLIALTSNLYSLKPTRGCMTQLDRTPLMVACSKGRLEVARMLLEFGADSNAADAVGSLLC